VMCCCCRSAGWNWAGLPATSNTNIAFPGPSCDGDGLWTTGEPLYDAGACQWLWHCVASLAVALEDVTRLACAVCRNPGSTFTVALFVRDGATPVTRTIVGLADTSEGFNSALGAVVCEIDL
jgi:hypothetical protein